MAFSIFNRSGGGLMDVIRCDEPDYLIWKWHPKGTEAGKNRRENAIRWGSSLRVREGSVAVFVYKQKDGVYEDFIEGPFDEILKTANLPVISELLSLAYKGETPFQAEVYFINLAKVIQVRFGVPYFEVFDPRFSDYSVPVAVRGTISFHVKNYREFVSLHRIDTFSIDDFQNQIRDAVIGYIKGVVTNIPGNVRVPVVQIERFIPTVSEVSEKILRKRLLNDYGVYLTGLDISDIEIDKGSEEYQVLRSITQDVLTAKIKVQNEVEIQNIVDMQRINAKHIEASLKAQREEDQYSRHLCAQTDNILAYQIDRKAQVAQAGAEALGKMGSGENLGRSEFDRGNMMASMAVGGTIGESVAEIVNSMMNDIQQPVKTQNPHVNTNNISSYYVVVNGISTGPYTIQTFAQMVSAGIITKDSLVWKQGMQNWMKANMISELQRFFKGGDTTPPPIPVM